MTPEIILAAASLFITSINLLISLKVKADVADAKVYMHENFQSKQVVRDWAPGGPHYERYKGFKS